VPMTLRDLRGEPLEWLLDLVIGDDVLRFAQRPAEVATGIDGTAYRYEPGLSLQDVEDGLQLYATRPASKRVDITIDLPLGGNLPELVEGGLDVSSATGVLRLWSPSTDRLEVVVAGVVRGVEYGAPEEPLTFSLEEVEEDDAGRFPAEGARVTSTTWPNASSAALGERYPWVIGEPGAGTSYAGPALFVDTVTDRLLVAGHPVVATAVGVINDKDGTSDALAVLTAQDGLGRHVSIVDLTGSAVTIDPDASYYIAWGVSGGGLAGGDGAMMVGAGDVLRWMLSYSKLRIDHGRLAAVIQRLNVYRIDTVISADPEERFAPWDWIVDHLLPILPISVRSSSDGFAPVVWRYEATAEEAVAHIEAASGRDGVPRAVRRSSVSYSERSDIANRLTLSYAHDPRADSYTREATITGDPAEVGGDVSLDLSCAVSRTRYTSPDGGRVSLVMEETSEAIWSSATAAAVLRWWARRYALQARLVGYTADREIAGHLEPGDVVTVTDPDLAWESKLFLVEEVLRSSGSSVDLDLRSIEDPGAHRHRST
jgi:hypothetical protein